MTAPLQGLRVLELARILAGPWAGQMLADLGADVIKVESPGGDDTRQWGPPFIGETAAYFHACNRGKRSFIADFSEADGRNRVLELVRDADILIENFKVGGLAKFGLDYPTLSALNPRLIYCSITGFGQTGPSAARAGYDYIIQGMSGLMSVTGAPEGEPQKVGVAVTDILTGTYACSAILAALHRRSVTGQGSHIDLALFDVALAGMANQAMNARVNGVAPKRLGNAHPNLAPYQVFSCADGHVILAVGNDGQFAKLCAALGCADLVSDPRFATNPARVAHREELSRRLGGIIIQMQKDEFLTLCNLNSIPAGPIYDLVEAFEDPQAQFHDIATTTDGIPTIRSPFRFNGAAVPMNGAAPDLTKRKTFWR